MWRINAANFCFWPNQRDLTVFIELSLGVCFVSHQVFPRIFHFFTCRFFLPSTQHNKVIRKLIEITQREWSNISFTLHACDSLVFNGTTISLESILSMFQYVSGTGQLATCRSTVLLGCISIQESSTVTWVFLWVDLVHVHCRNQGLHTFRLPWTYGSKEKPVEMFNINRFWVDEVETLLLIYWLSFFAMEADTQRQQQMTTTHRNM